MVNLEKWNAMPTYIKMLNIGSEVSRTIKYHEEKSQYAEISLFRVLEMIDITTVKGFSGNWELCRVRELICDLVINGNTANNSGLKSYFNYFGMTRV
jgi:hypothetical protein